MRERIALGADSAILFDLDGTLAETDDLHAQAYANAVRELCGVEPDMSGYIDACVRGGMRPIEFLRSTGIKANPRHLHLLKSREYRFLIAESLSLRPGAHHLLVSLDELGVLTALVSSSSRASVEVFVEKYWPAGRPHVIVARDSQQLRPKPSGDPYRLALARLGADPVQCVAFENSPAGVAAVHEAGPRCIVVRSNYFGAADFGRDELFIDSFLPVTVERAAGGCSLIVGSA